MAILDQLYLEHVPWVDNEGRKKGKEVKVYWVEEKKN